MTGAELDHLERSTDHSRQCSVLCVEREGRWCGVALASHDLFVAAACRELLAKEAA